MTTIVRGRWYPAAVRLPDGVTVRRVYVVLAEGGGRHGLHIWSKPDGEPGWRYDVDWTRTRVPAREHDGRNGFDVHLTDGRLAVVTTGAGCRCGTLGRWAGPSWATSVAAGAR